MQKRGSVLIILVIILAVAGIFGAYYLGTQKPDSTQIFPSEKPESPKKDSGNSCTMDAKICPDGTSVGRTGPNCEFAPCPGETSGTDASGWKTYTNTTYGFSIKYPPSYQALTDSNNLYGWKNAVVLIYKGGQSYDLAIQVWDTEEEYKQEYKDLSNITAYEIG